MGEAGDGLGPVVAVSEADHDEALVLHALGLCGVASGSFRVFVMRSIDVDRGVMVRVKEVWPRVAILDKPLSVAGQSQMMLVEEVEPAAFEVRAGHA
jgi:hypothetical protein